ncbi:DUF4169 family protein [Cochlodiniinecator piscidefendens]|uniref:DUF4169 family protein n=1 Tax=Cochlodiniinecator piscidefendens TaxID=2715756 RepID=UPI00140D3BD1|nr:DUF4169 family protein [Cochlodiniinecator piscidefendens]
MAKIVNLTRARKSRARDAKRKTAAQNAAKFGQTRTESADVLRDLETLKSHLDQHKLDKDNSDLD